MKVKVYETEGQLQMDNDDFWDSCSYYLIYQLNNMVIMEYANKHTGTVDEISGRYDLNGTVSTFFGDIGLDELHEMCDGTLVDNALKNSGIYEKVISTRFFDRYRSSMKAVVITECGRYVITFNNNYINNDGIMEYTVLDASVIDYDKFIQNHQWHPGELLNDGKVVECYAKSLFNCEECRIPLRSVLEAIGATVVWDGNNNTVLISFKGKTYNCNFDTRYEWDKSLDVKCDGEYIQLSDMCADTAFWIIDNSTYIRDEAAKRLLKHFEYDLEIDMTEQKVCILSQA